MEDLYYAYNPWWEDKEFDSGIPREDYLDEIQKPFQRKQIDIIIGSRRVGKTTFLRQLIKSCLNRNIPAKRICYLALDHPRFINVTISEHLRYFRKIFGHSISGKLYLFLDEVQTSPNWETELKILYDLENLKIICTGSTSSLIKQQGGKLTGRQIITQIYPLSFREFLDLKIICLLDQRVINMKIYLKNISRLVDILKMSSILQRSILIILLMTLLPET